MARKPRPFDPEALKRLATTAIRPQLGPETLVRRYTVFVPTDQIRYAQPPRSIATLDDLEAIQSLLIRHFGGVTVSTTTPSLLGWGARDPRQPKKSLEVNKQAYFLVYAAAVRASDEFFLALQRELTDALVEGVILVERQDVTIL